jgi:hypothetical protein
MAKRSRTPPTTSDDAGKAPGRRPRPGYVHSSIYVPDAAHEALREAAFKERCKIHDIIMQGVEMALRKRGYPPIEELKAKYKGKDR